MNFVAGVRTWQHSYSLTQRVLKPPASLHHHCRHYYRSLERCTAASGMEGSAGGGLASALWNKHRLQAMLALYHPFVVSLATGVLDIRSFRHYIAQDAFFLQAFATAYGLAQDNVDDALSKLSINQLQQAVMDELRLHSSYAEAWGVDLSIGSNPNETTLKYTQLLLAPAAGTESSRRENLLDRRKVAALTIGAMTPCMRLYAFLGQEIKKHIDEKFSETLYHDWVNTYSSKPFQSSTLQIEQLLENLAAHLGEEDMLQLESLYSQAIILELEFFSAQPNCQCALLPFIKRQDMGSDSHYVLMTDFDLTCSVTDSCAAITSASIKASVEKDPQKSSSDLKRKWDFLEKSYSEQYSRIASLPVDQENCNRCYDAGGLRTFLENLSDFEVQSNSEVVKQRVFEGLNLEDLRRAGAEMALQDGCSDFFRRVSLHGHVDAHIVSVCWSQSFIEGALSKEGMDFVKIHSNELSVCGSCTSGDLVRVIETPLDKERVFEELMRNAKEHSKFTQSIYIGDSVTDLMCLLKADLGIIVGLNSTLRRVSKAYGVSLVPLYKGVLEKVKFGGRQCPGVLYTATGWHEIYAYLIGLPDS